MEIAMSRELLRKYKKHITLQIGKPDSLSGYLLLHQRMGKDAQNAAHMKQNTDAT